MSAHGEYMLGPDSEISVKRLRVIDQLADRFEQEFRTGSKPCIEDFLSSEASELRPYLLRELLALELKLRRNAGEQPALGEYLQRFPDDSSTVQTVFEKIVAYESSSTQRSDRTKSDGYNLNEARNFRGLKTVFADSDRDSTKLYDRANSVQPSSLPEIDGYVLIEELARGGMGVVYRAHDKDLDRTVALKLMLKSELVTAEERMRFEREARLAAKLSHRNIVPVFEFGYINDLPFLAMEFVYGPTLQQKICESLPEPIEAARLIREVSLAIGYAHDNGIVHRDLKPANILMDAGTTPRVTDFGLARGDADRQLTATEAIMGTPSYMAPEQAAGRMNEVGRRSDVYALGAVLYACLTGRPPHKAENKQLTLMQVLEAPIIPPSERVTTIPRDLESICLKCLARQPEHRYASANELVADLDRFLDSKPVLARPRRWREKAESWMRSNVAMLAVLLAFVVSVLPVTLLSGLSNNASEAEPRNASKLHLKFLEEILKANPQDVAARLRHAEWELETGRFDDCLEDISTAENVGGADSQTVALVRCKALVGKKNWSEALQHANLVLSHDTRNAEAHYWVGRIHLALGDDHLAVNSLSTAISLRPDYAAAYRMRADAHAALNDIEAERTDRDAVQKLLGASDDIINNWQQ